MIKAADIHPACTPECTHRQVPTLGGIIVQRPVDRDRMDYEADLIAWMWGNAHRRQDLTDRVEYLGIQGEGDGVRHTWRLGAKAWRPIRSASRDEGKTVKREIKTEHRPAVWLGNGEPVGPVDFSRVPEEIKADYPAPSLTSDQPYDQPSSGPAAGLLKHAMTLGWDGVITYARGHVPHATHGTPGKDAKFSEALRLQRGDQRAVAVRMDGSWTSLWTWSPSQFFTRHKTLEAFQGALT